MGLVEDSSQARPKGISVELERLGEVHISKNRCNGTQSLQIIKGLMAPVIPLNGSLLLASIFTQNKLMQGLGYLHEFWDKSSVISHESQETSDLHGIFGDWPLLDSFYFALISGYSFGRDHMPQIGNLPSE